MPRGLSEPMNSALPVNSRLGRIILPSYSGMLWEEHPHRPTGALGFVSSTGNFNTITLDRVKMNTAFVGNTGHFDNEIDLVGPRA